MLSFLNGFRLLTHQVLTESPDRKRKVTPGIASKLNQDEKEQVVRVGDEVYCLIFFYMDCVSSSLFTIDSKQVLYIPIE